MGQDPALPGIAGAPPAPRCFNGSPYQPIPVTDEASTAMALQIMERREDFPGVSAELTAVREYPQPLAANAAHSSGLPRPGHRRRAGCQGPGQLPARCQRDRAATHRPDRPGRAGAAVRRRPARTPPGSRPSRSTPGRGRRDLAETPPTPGNNLITTIDAKVQAVAERRWAAIVRARKTGDIPTARPTLKADSGAVVVMDVRTGGIVAMASYPSYDPNIWVGGISTRTTRRSPARRTTTRTSRGRSRASSHRPRRSRPSPCRQP